LPVDGLGVAEVRRNGLVLQILNTRSGLKSSTVDAPSFSRLEASAIDRRITVALDGVPLFDPIDYSDNKGSSFGSQSNPVAIGVLGGSMEVRRFRIYRDIYYTGNPNQGLRRPFGIDTPYFLKADEFFVLGDNSPISNDSRFWEKSPVVRGDSLLGKPFLVHLPGQVCPLKVFGRPLGWIPDPREIRYIR
jgi:signal peptidase I